jgi:hypothetical protein
MYHEWHARELSCFGNVGTLYHGHESPSHLGWLEAHKQKAYGQIQGHIRIMVDFHCLTLQYLGHCWSNDNCLMGTCTEGSP